tara:strand:- start:5300 stop:7567 length:2268 start_codon:yes stop_codon:yes gene_type:complete
MGIDLDRNKRTFRSDVKSRSGGRLPGLEMFEQGLDLKSGDIARGCLPILGRSGHEYSAVNAVYKSSSNIDELGKQKTIDLQIQIDSGASYYGASETNFNALVGDEFTIQNPEYQFDASQPASWRFKFTGTAGVDPRLPYQADGLYASYPGRLGDSFNYSLYSHLLKPLPREPFHTEFETTNSVLLANYGLAGSDGFGVFYEIPIGLPSTAFPASQRSNNDASSIDIPVANFDLTRTAVFQRLASNPYWLYAVVTRALYQVLPSYFKILDPEGTNHPNINKETGAHYLWDKFDLSDMTNAAAIRIKIKHEKNGAVQNPVSNAVTSADISLESWNFTVPHEWTRSGYREAERINHVYYEDFRSDFLKQTEIRPVSTNVAAIALYSPQISQGTSTPQFSAGVEITKYEETLSGTAAPIDQVITSELLSIRKTQKREIVANTHRTDHTYYEDVHYVDPDGQTHSELNDKWKQWVNVSDHGNVDQAAFVAHLENMFDKRYSPTRLMDEHPMSGRVDIFDRVNSFYSNMPETIVSNTRKSLSAQSFDLESILIIKNKYLKRSEEIEIKKFEDLKGKRDEGEEEYHLIKIKPTTTVFTHPPSSQLVPSGIYRSYKWEYLPAGLVFHIKYANGFFKVTFVSITAGFPSQGQQNADFEYMKRIPRVNPGESIMFEDYFDQQEPEVLDYIEEERWSRIDDEMMVWLTQKYWDNDNDPSTIDVATGRSIKIDRREWQQSDYLYTNTGHTAVHSSRVNGIIAQEHKR